MAAHFGGVLIMFIPGCQACNCVTIGFDNLANWAITSCYTGHTFQANLYANVSLISPLRLVFCRFTTSVFDNPFNSADWSAVASWVSGGGRLFLGGDYSGSTMDYTTANNFLSAIGSSMSVVSGNVPTANCASGVTAGTANIAAGLSTFPGVTTYTSVSGGTDVFLGPVASEIILAVEAVGNGFVFASGDWTPWIFNSGGCDSCEFSLRLLDYADGDII